MFVNVIPLKECFPNWPKPVVFDSSYIDTRWLLPYTRHAISACVPLSRETYVYRTESPTLFKTCFCDTASRHFLDREMDDVVWHSQKTDGMFVSYTCRMNNCSIPQHCKTLFFGLRTQSKRCAQLAIIKKKNPIITCIIHGHNAKKILVHINHSYILHLYTHAIRRWRRKIKLSSLYWRRLKTKIA